MRVYHERLRVPFSWWAAGLGTIAILATETVAGWPPLVAYGIYAVLVGFVVALLLNWGRPSIDVGGGELRVGQARLPLAAIGEVTAMDEAQTRSLRGPRGDPAAYLYIRPYLRQAVYVEVTSPVAAPQPAAETGSRQGRLRLRRRPKPVKVPGAGAPYWLVCTRHPAELAAAISASRPATRVDGATMG